MYTHQQIILTTFENSSSLFLQVRDINCFVRTGHLVESGKTSVVDLISILVLESDLDIIVYIRYEEIFFVMPLKKKGKKK